MTKIRYIPAEDKVIVGGFYVGLSPFQIAGEVSKIKARRSISGVLRRLRSLSENTELLDKEEVEKYISQYHIQKEREKRSTQERKKHCSDPRHGNAVRGKNSVRYDKSKEQEQEAGKLYEQIAEEELNWIKRSSCKIKKAPGPGYEFTGIRERKTSLVLSLDDFSQLDSLEVNRDFKQHVGVSLCSVGLDYLVLRLNIQTSMNGELVFIEFPRLCEEDKRGADLFLRAYSSVLKKDLIRGKK